MGDARVTRILAMKQQQDRERVRVRTYRTVTPPPLSFADRFPDGAWRGQRCFIVGGGPSLKAFDFGRLRGERVIAINKAFIDVPFADIMFAMDRPLLDLITTGKIDEDYRTKNPGGPARDYRQAFASFWGVKLWLDLSNYSYPAGVYSIPSAGDIGWTRSLREGLYHGQNSGYGALNLALVLGADPIYLLGYDCSTGPAGEKNYHNGYPSGTNPDALNIFKRAFEEGAAMLEGGHRIINLNSASALRCFKFGDVDEVLPPAGRPGGGITAITPTGDRPLAFRLCQQWMAHQTRRPDKWIIIDDGKAPMVPDLAWYNAIMPGVAVAIRREPQPDDPQHTLNLNLMAALPHITGDKILIIEDDEYYAPGYIEEMARRLDSHEVVGICRSKYYHLPSGGYSTIGNATHASLAETAFRSSFLPEIKEILSGSSDPYVDMRIWQKAGSRGSIFVDNDKPLYLGIKGLPGRGGIGQGHNPAIYGNRKGAADRSVLKKWVPNDHQAYLDIVSGKLNDGNCGSYFPPVVLPVTGITVCSNTKDLIERAYTSIRKFHPDMPIVIVDGSNPNDPCAAYVRGLASEITTVVSPGYNVGHGRGLCMGIDKAKTRYALIFDSDIEMRKSPIEAMLAMMEDDTFGVGYIEEKTALDGFEWGWPGHDTPGEWMRYLHPMFQLINIGNYRKFHPYVHHGAPCYLAMLDIHKRGLSGKILKSFPGLGHTSGRGLNWTPVPGEHIRHDTRGTCSARAAKRLPEIEGGWTRKRPEDLPCTT